MITEYINSLMHKATYEKDESGYIFANIPGYQGFFSQGKDFEEARENLIDAIQGVITLKLMSGDSILIKDMQTLSQNTTHN